VLRTASVSISRSSAFVFDDCRVKVFCHSKVDVLGFSIGGFVAQEIAGQAPGLVRRLILVGTGPRGGEGMANLTPEAQQIFGASYEEPDHLWLAVHFTRSEASQAAGRDFLKRFRLRKENRDPEVNEKVAFLGRPIPFLILLICSACQVWREAVSGVKLEQAAPRGRAISSWWQGESTNAVSDMPTGPI
jgi:pimeloyl-ACP methyl ester carboxylesterase